jgi:effector-binding domain-containing protein
MKILKVIGMIILLIAVIVIVVPYFLSNSASTTASIEINAKPQVVFRQVNNYKNWKSWSPFEEDKTMVDTYSGPEQGVGAARSWVGEETGTGSMTIIESDPYLYIRNNIVFGPEGSGGVDSWNFGAKDEGTKVSWTIHILNLGYFQRWFGLMINFTLKPIMEKGLSNLKKYAEGLPDPPKVKTIIMDPQPTMVVYDSSTMEGMPAMFEKNNGDLMSFLKKKSIPITGERFAIYHTWNPEGITQVSTGIPVDKERKGSGRVSYFELPGGEAVFANHVGGSNTAVTHDAIEAYIKDFNLETRGYIWESYHYDPLTEPDSTKWKTFIYYPLK